jgi:hypothetical protein
LLAADLIAAAITIIIAIQFCMLDRLSLSLHSH